MNHTRVTLELKHARSYEKKRHNNGDDDIREKHFTILQSLEAYHPRSDEEDDISKVLFTLYFPYKSKIRLEICICQENCFLFKKEGDV
jgi:hypothetical protein